MKLIIKILINGFIVVSLFTLFTNATFWEATISATILSVIAYMVGDQIILRTSNNTIATIADAVLAFVYLWAVAYFMNWDLSFGELVIITLILGVAEAVYHRFLASDRSRAA